MEATSTHQPGIFVSHSHIDKAFARRLARDLIDAGARVWIDEAEIQLGDSLLEKIRFGIDQMDYLGVVLSPESVASPWVKQEVEIAMNQEIDGRRVKVLPLLHRSCEFPSFLKGKLYADFSSDDKYSEGFQLILRRLGLVFPETPLNSEERLSNLAASHSLLAVALEEIAQKGLKTATISALLSSGIRPQDLAEFLGLVARDAQGWKLFGIASAALDCLDKFGVGQDVIDYCLEAERLDSTQKDSLATYMAYVSNPAAVLWCHDRLVSRIKSDVRYNTFIQRHAAFIEKSCKQPMFSYLLRPDRGPDSYNIDTFFDLIMLMEQPDPLLIRWKEWIRDGRFDGNHEEGDEGAAILYKYFNRAIDKGSEKLDSLMKHTHDRVYLLLKNGNERYKGLYHLVAMVNARYRCADDVLENIISRVNPSELLPDETKLFFVLGRAFRLLVRGSEVEIQEEWEKIAEADTVTGFWTNSKRFQNQK